MKKLKNLFCVVMCIVVAGCAFAGCASKEELKAKISELENTINNEVTELKSSISSLNTTVAALNRLLQENSEGLDDLKGQIEALTTKVNELTTKVTAAEARITVLEGIASGENEPKVYQVGVEGNDTFTFVNNGIKLFSVKITTCGTEEGLSGIYVRGTITNFNMPYVKSNNYIGISLMKNDKQTTYLCENQTEDNLLLNETKIFGGVFNSRIDASSISHIVIGIPNQAPSLSSIIPYAKFAL